MPQLGPQVLRESLPLPRFLQWPYRVPCKSAQENRDSSQANHRGRSAQPMDAITCIAAGPAATSPFNTLGTHRGWHQVFAGLDSPVTASVGQARSPTHDDYDDDDGAELNCALPTGPSACVNATEAWLPFSNQGQGLPTFSFAARARTSQAHASLLSPYSLHYGVFVGRELYNIPITPPCPFVSLSLPQPIHQPQAFVHECTLHPRQWPYRVPCKSAQENRDSSQANHRGRVECAPGAHSTHDTKLGCEARHAKTQADLGTHVDWLVTPVDMNGAAAEARTIFCDDAWDQVAFLYTCILHAHRDCVVYFIPRHA
jgi:hypothetical protein